MTLYHGTNIAFEAIDLLKGSPGKDFGRGFYLTDSLECAVLADEDLAEIVGRVKSLLGKAS